MSHPHTSRPGVRRSRAALGAATVLAAALIVIPLVVVAGAPTARRTTAIPRASVVVQAPAASGARTSARPPADKSVDPLGPIDPSLTLDVSFVLRARSGLAQAAAATNDPHAPNYRRYLTPGEIADRYGPDPTDVTRAERVLRAAGLALTTPGRQGLLLEVRGTARQFETLLDVHILRYSSKNGRLAIAPDHAPRLAAVFGGTITGVLGLDTRTLLHTSVQMTPASPSSAQLAPGVTAYTPADLDSAYDIGPLHQAGLDGAGQTIALTEIDKVKPSDVQSYDEAFGISAPPLEVIKVNGGATSTSPEPALDIEGVHALAPHAQILVYESPPDLNSIARMLSQIVSDNRAQVISMSLGTCERGLDQSDTQGFLPSLDDAFQRAAAQGISVLVASGDSGAYDCQDNSLSVGAVASNPYVTAVGGTTLFLDHGVYGHEAGWEGPLEAAGSGGGVSIFNQRPSWQAGTGVGNAYSDGMRQVPDVSANADPLTGYLIYYATSGCQGDACWQVVGGTSAAAPLWASLILLANQRAAASHKPPLGFLDPALYQLGSGASATQVYHDITLGGNLYYQSTPSWDYSTGWGSPDGAKLVEALLALG
ncbi:MAG: S53 family peptidase [Ktedonobacterales bacterium]